MTVNDAKHATLTFERICNARPERVFAAFAGAAERERWSTPSDTAAFSYEESDFRVGGRDVFRCGSKDDPQFRGVTIYHDILPNQRIVWSEAVEAGGARLFASLVTVTFAAEGAQTRLNLTVQIASFVGDAMIEGTLAGNTAALENLVTATTDEGASQLRSSLAG